MVIFHSYVNLPEGIVNIPLFGKNMMVSPHNGLHGRRLTGSNQDIFIATQGALHPEQWMRLAVGAVLLGGHIEMIQPQNTMKHLHKNTGIIDRNDIKGFHVFFTEAVQTQHV